MTAQEFTVTIEIPGKRPRTGEKAPDMTVYCKPYEGQLFDVWPPTSISRLWTLMFFSRADDLPVKLNNALVRDMIISYTIEKRKG